MKHLDTAVAEEEKTKAEEVEKNTARENEEAEAATKKLEQVNLEAIQTQ